MIEIIAEIGINHNGDMALARNMIWKAKEAGANVAKFQIYNPERVLDRNHPDLVDHWDTILKTELSRDQVCTLKEECDKADIEFLASVFRPEVVEWTEEIGMKRYKIASRSMYNEELARAIYATGKPAIISYGYCDGRCDALRMLDIEHTDLDSFDSKHKILYCVSQYPTPFSELNLSPVTFGYGGFDGFSDHTEGIIASVVAMSLGATTIEKHVTYDKTFDGPDHACSIDFSELRQLCEMRDQIEVILA